MQTNPSCRKLSHVLGACRLLASGLICLILLTLCRADAPTRPKIGLALSGGSALGIAQVGVLEWFDQHHVPVDCLAGTSMGGLVGGCYSMGMAPAEMRDLLKGINWDDALSGGPAFQTLSFRRKEDLREVPSRLELGLKHGIALPDGLLPAGPIGLLLSRVSLPYSEVRDFDDLPTPFRCVALDMGTGEAVAFHDGSLATALRATMAIPALFTPVEREGHLYTDGGSLENIPTEAVRAMGADIIIAVDLSGDFFEAKKPASLLDISGRTIAAMTYANERRSLKLADVILTPAFGPLSASQFNQVDAFVARGYEAADAKSRILERFALSDADWRAYVTQRDARKRSAVAPPAFVQIAGVGGRSADAVMARLKPFVGHPLDVTRLGKELTAITGEGRFASFQYQQITRQGTPGLLVYADEKKYGPPFVRLGLSVYGGDTDNIRTNLIARITGLDVGAPGAETRTDLGLGSDQVAAFEYYRPLSSMSRWFFAPQAFYRNTSVGLYSQGSRAAIYDDEAAGAGFDVGYSPSRLSEVRLGYRASHERASVVTGSPLLPSLSGGVEEARLQWTANGQDSPVLPSRGLRLHAETGWYFQSPGGGGPYPTAEANLSDYAPLGNGDTRFVTLGAGTTFGHQAGPLEQFTVGGPLRLGAYQPDEFRGNDYFLVTPGYLHRLGQLPSFLGGRIMAGGWYEVGGAFPRFGGAHILNDLSVGLVSETLLGPVAFSYSYGEAGRRKLSFIVGSFF